MIHLAQSKLLNWQKNDSRYKNESHFLSKRNPFDQPNLPTIEGGIELDVISKGIDTGGKGYVNLPTQSLQARTVSTCIPTLPTTSESVIHTNTAFQSDESVVEDFKTFAFKKRFYIKNLGKGNRGFVSLLYPMSNVADNKDDCLCVKIDNNLTRSSKELSIWREYYPEKYEKVNAKIDNKGLYKVKEGFLFLIPYFNGITLEQYCRENILSVQKRKELSYQMLESVSKLHSLGYLHRDIKLDNFILCRDSLYLIDFGRGVSLYADVKQRSLSENHTNRILRNIQLRLQPQVAPEHYSVNKCSIDIRSDLYAVTKIIMKLLPQYAVKLQPYCVSDLNERKFLTQIDLYRIFNQSNETATLI